MVNKVKRIGIVLFVTFLFLTIGCASTDVNSCAVEKYNPNQPVWWLACLESLEDSTNKNRIIE